MPAGISNCDLLLDLDGGVLAESRFSEDDVVAFGGAIGDQHAHRADRNDPVLWVHVAFFSMLLIFMREYSGLWDTFEVIMKA